MTTDLAFHYPPDVFDAVVDAVPLLTRGKKDVVLFFRGCGVDRAFLAGLPRVRVVHGSGMGVLRKALRQYLQKHPHVESVSEPPQNEGGAGATVVELRV